MTVQGVGRFTSQSGGEKVDVIRLILANLLEIGVEGRVVAGTGKVLLRELRKTTTIEVVLEMLKGQGIVEDIS